MIKAWLGREWNKIQPEIVGLGKPCAFQITRPHGNIESWGNYRVVRVREFDNLVEVVLAHEKYSPRQTLTP
ncbi:hypothetical protein [Desulfosporosinus sp.]|uniref:hypothetical protein n=1 Tax=Desulfosporosinus sp. TaxID=157907 RepID=UPI000E88948A|nr:hypothetical protein [Desulfosporosinus sp.]MBC2722485.1 hypothetical protein [Desulfosporosinus sp.]MBC2728290.1 hypothetical protein [Desulfosporosinus sp.]HBV87353.1 hypothetical protein [Desulfosporosinus sp.]